MFSLRNRHTSSLRRIRSPGGATGATAQRRILCLHIQGRHERAEHLMYALFLFVGTLPEIQLLQSSRA